MTDEEVTLYYVCFVRWLRFVHPHIGMRFAAGHMGAEGIQRYIREWAEDITDKEEVINDY